MGLQIVIKKRFEIKLQKVTKYLSVNWGRKEAETFVMIVIERITQVSEKPNIGSVTAIKNTRSVFAGKGNQNKIYYRLEENKLIVIDMRDTRMNPKSNRFNM